MIDGAHPAEDTVRRVLKLAPESFGHNRGCPRAEADSYEPARIRLGTAHPGEDGSGRITAEGQ